MISLNKTANMLQEDAFWDIIQRSLIATDQPAQEHFLITEIEKLIPTDIIGFQLRTDYLLYHTYNAELWCACELMNKECTDAGFEDFRCWIISRGKNTYYNAKANADLLVNEIVEGVKLYAFKNFKRIALVAFGHKTGKNLIDYIDYENFTTREWYYPQLKFEWHEENPETMKKICPKLYAKCYA